MSKDTEDVAAFPTQPGFVDQGMCLRDWFAGQEQLSDLDSADLDIGIEKAEALDGPHPGNEPLAQMQWEALWRAKLRYIRADAMMKARQMR